MPRNEARATDRVPVRGLYALTPAIDDPGLLVRMMEAALEGGVSVVQYRAKLAAPQLASIVAAELAKLCGRFGVPLIVNDSAEIAATIGAGVHLGRDDMAPAEARKCLPGAIIGVSCYDSLARADAAIRDGADYVAFGSVFASATKPHAVRADLDLLRRSKERGYPTVAIGGINVDNAPLALDAGADAIAVINALFDSPNTDSIRARARQFNQLFRTSHA